MAPAPAGGSLRPARAAHRYRPGQAPAGYTAPDEDSEEESDDEQGGDEASLQKKRSAAPHAMTRNDGLQIVNQGAGATRQLKVQVKTDPEAAAAAQRAKDEDESESEDEESEEETPRTLPKSTYRAPSGIKAAPVAKEESSEYESSSGEEESEEEAPPVPIYKPVFVSKRNRDTLGKKEGAPNGENDEEAELKLQAELEERRKQSTYLAAEAIKRGLADKESTDLMPNVDDTDGIDPEGEFEAWKLRELMRIIRDREAKYAREKEREEIEARRAVPEALRLKEDTERAKKLREEKMANRGQRAFLQKFHHKGAFYTDENADVLSKHDFNAATESTLVSTDSLPKVMQVRNYGKMGRTKYTHLADQDTTDRAAGWAAGGRPGGSMGKQGANNLDKGCFHCGGPHMKAECRELQSAGPSGANAGPVRSRPRSRDRSRSPGQGERRDRGWARDKRDQRDEREDRRYRDKRSEDDRRDRRRSRSRSRSRSRDRHGGEKRRRRD